MPNDWSAVHRDIKNFRWSAADQELFEAVATIVGWGPERSLLEIGVGRGLTAMGLYASGRSRAPTGCDTCPEAEVLAGRQGVACYPRPPDIPVMWDIVLSLGVVEHEIGVGRRRNLIADHIRLSREWVVIGVPVYRWQRRVFGRQPPVDQERLFPGGMLRELQIAATLERERARADFGCVSCAPLFGIPHIPDAAYPTFSTIARRLGWQGGFEIAWMRKNQ